MNFGGRLTISVAPFQNSDAGARRALQPEVQQGPAHEHPEPVGVNVVDGQPRSARRYRIG